MNKWSSYHELNVKDFIVDEVLHECLEAPLFVTDLLEVVECGEDDLVTSLDQADRG